MNTLLILALLAASPEAINPQDACESASRVLKDMRYVEGKTADPGDFTHPKIKARIQSCVQVARLAAPHGEGVRFTSSAIAYNESNFRRGVKGSAGELGKMQVLPRLHCKPYADLNDGKGGCTNPERAGVRLVRLLLAKHPLEKALKRYNGSTAYAKKVSRFVEAAQRSYDRQHKG